MDDASLYKATVPVLLHYLRRFETMLLAIPAESLDMLEHRLAGNAFCASEHLETAIGFTTRTVLPLMGRETADKEFDSLTRDELVRLARDASVFLESLSLSDFDGASERTVWHTAGTAELEQDAVEFVTLFALPNFFFHFASAFSILRQQGANIGKADFDGLHVYEPGFRF